MDFPNQVVPMYEPAIPLAYQLYDENASFDERLINLKGRRDIFHMLSPIDQQQLIADINKFKQDFAIYIANIKGEEQDARGSKKRKKHTRRKRRRGKKKSEKRKRRRGDKKSKKRGKSRGK